VVAISQPPEWLRRAGLAAFDRHEPDVPIAHLDLDTLMLRTSDPETPRLLRFSSSSRTVNICVVSKPRSVTLLITVAPPGKVGIDVRPLRGVTRHISTDDRGTATCRSVPLGPLSLLVRWPPSRGGSVRTAWTQV
jgi:hypothetical protein